jgi:small-conductance mechanosensitive channel
MKMNRKKLMCLTGCFLILATLFFIKSSAVFSSYSDPVDEEIKTLNDQIQNQKKQLENIAKRQEEYAKLIKQKGQDQNTLQSQLEILDGRLSQSEL